MDIYDDDDNDDADNDNGCKNSILKKIETKSSPMIAFSLNCHRILFSDSIKCIAPLVA